MAKALVVVESPAKAKTINKYLGRNYKVVASMGHVRDLPKSKLGVDVDDGFEPSYEVIASRKKVLKELKDAAKDASEIFVATDPDREGEAIGWHLAEELGSGNRKKIRRLMFNEITKKGVLAALEHPTQINKQMVDAQQARRVLDRLVGYKISPLLWDKVRRGLSAGRVQSVALKLVVDREREIDRFIAEEYWNITAHLAGPVPPEFDAKLLKRDGANIKVGNKEEADAALADLRKATWVVNSVTTKERKKGAVPPFITSKLQQAARLPGQEDDDDRAAAVRGHRAAGRRRRRAHHLHANRLDARGGSGADRSPRVHRHALRRGYRAREADLLPCEEGRAGRARGNPADVDEVSPGRDPGQPHARPVLPL